MYDGYLTRFCSASLIRIVRTSAPRANREICFKLSPNAVKRGFMLYNSG